MKAGTIGCGCIVFLVFIVAAGLFGPHSAPNSKEGGAATETAAPAPDPHKAEEDLQQKTAMTAGAALKSSVRDPDSLVIETGLASHDGKLLCVRYRARNGFGGMNREAVAFMNKVPHESASFWNKNCANRTLDDVTDNVKLGASMGG